MIGKSEVVENRRIAVFKLFAALFQQGDRGAVRALFIVNPTKSISEAGVIRSRLPGLLRYSHRNVEISTVFGVVPGQIVRGGGKVSIEIKHLAVVLISFVRLPS